MLSTNSNLKRSINHVWGNRMRMPPLTVKNDSHGPEIHSGVVLPATHHLRSHVQRRASEDALLIPRWHVLGKTKIWRQRQMLTTFPHSEQNAAKTPRDQNKSNWQVYMTKCWMKLHSYIQLNTFRTDVSTNWTRKFKMNLLSNVQHILTCEIVVLSEFGANVQKNK